jgi:5'-3' exonuclease
MIALLDGDIFVYRVAAACANEPLELAKITLDELLERTCAEVKAASYFLYLSNEESYRKIVDASYKANRPQEKPKHLEPLREHLVMSWSVSFAADGLEADDEISLKAHFLKEKGAPYCVVSIDKDLQQIPGYHYNFVRQDFFEVSEQEAKKHFWKQMLIGDGSDNVKGVLGIGPVKAGKAIDPLEDEADMAALVSSLYTDQDKFKTNLQLLWILKHQRDPHEVLSHYRSLQKLSVEVE